MTTLLTLSWSLWLSWHDYRSLSFPLWIWLVFHLGLLCHFPLTPASLFLLLLGGLAEWRPIGIGSGDFLYLASLALVLDGQALLWLVQLASLIGIGAHLALRKKKAPLPFIPCLSLAYGIICLL